MATTTMSWPELCDDCGWEIEEYRTAYSRLCAECSLREEELGLEPW